MPLGKSRARHSFHELTVSLTDKLFEAEAAQVNVLLSTSVDSRNGINQRCDLLLLKTLTIFEIAV